MQSIVNLLTALDETNVAFVLVGGQAMQLHGSQRNTVDVDLVLQMDDANLARFITVAKQFSLKPIIPVSLESLANAELIQQWYEEKGMLAFALREAAVGGMVVDVLVRCEVPFEVLNRRANSGNLNGATIRFASVEDLLTMKRAANRDKDLSDIAFLERIQQMRQKP
jgi:predicted nucleotidyltransferase